MIANLKPYPAVKDSGVPWLGRIPKGWDLRRGKFLFRYKKELNSSGSNTNVLSLTLRGVVNNDPNNPEGLVPKDYASYQQFRKDDLVFKLIDLENIRTSRVGLVHEDGIMSPAYVRLSLLPGGNVRYFYYQFFDLYLRGVFNQLGAGVRATLGPSDLLDLNIAVPGRDEQAKIVQYLDAQERRINRLIRAKQKLIALLNEQKQAIIHRAVTRGLDPNVRLKPSGIDWLGDVPEDWDIAALKRFVLRHPGSIKAGPFGSQLKALDMQGVDVKVYNQRNVIDRDLSKGDNFVSHTKFEALRAFEVFPGDVLVTSRGTIGRTALVTEKDSHGILHPCLIRVQTDGARLKPEFLMVLIQDSQLLPRQIQLLSNATTIDVIYSGTLASLVIPVPSLHQQEEILHFIDKNVAGFDRGVAQCRCEINLLREYRTRLIADVVTGKLDVRGVELPSLDKGEAGEDLDTGEGDETEEMTDSDEAADGDE